MVDNSSNNLDLKKSSKAIDSILESLNALDGTFLNKFENFINLVVNIGENVEDIKEEIVDFNDVYQFHLIGKNDFRYDFWITK